MAIIHGCEYLTCLHHGQKCTIQCGSRNPFFDGGVCPLRHKIHHVASITKTALLGGAGWSRGSYTVSDRIIHPVFVDPWLKADRRKEKDRRQKRRSEIGMDRRKTQAKQLLADDIAINN